MKKWMVPLVCILWAAALIQTICQSSQPERLPVNIQNMDGMIPASVNTSFRQTQASLELSSPYPDYLPFSKQQELLTALAREFSIASPPAPVTVQKKNGSITSLLHESANGTLSLEYLSIQNDWNTSDYLRIRLMLPSSLSLTSFSSVLEQIKIRYGLTGTICTLIQGTYSRPLTATERQAAASSLFDTLDASPVQSIRDGGTDTFYGYTDSIDSYIRSDQDKINVTIAFSDGSDQTTSCYIGSPIILDDY